MHSNSIEILRRRAETQTDITAYIFLKDGEIEQSRITYGELDFKARAIAVQLQQMNLVGSRALMVYPYESGLEFIAAFLGCLYAGVIAVPCHPPRNQHGLADLQARLKSSQAEIVLTQQSILAKHKKQLDKPQLQWLSTEKVDRIASAWVEPQINADSLAFLQYTSGSTGVPKGVEVSHGCLMQNQEMLKLAFSHDENTVGVGWLPLFHDMGLIGNVIQSLYLGIPCIVMSPIAFIQKPIRWLNAISRYRGTTSGAPNFAYELLCRHVSEAEIANLDLSSWDVAFSGAESVSYATIERFSAKFVPCGFRKTAFYPCYGMAEATLLISGGEKTAAPIVKYVEEAALEQNAVKLSIELKEGYRPIISCGRAWLDETIAIVDPESAIELGSDRVGEIWVSGSGIAKGYWNQPEETQRTFQAKISGNGADNFMRTGDLGFLVDGELFVTGRLHDVIVFWGINHYPQHLEETVEKCHPGLRLNSSAAFAVKVEGKDRLAIAVEVERSYRRCLAIDEVVEAIRWALFNEHFVDVYAIALLQTGSIPKTSSGKIQRSACRDRFQAGTLDLLGEWRSPVPENSDIRALIGRYINPLTHFMRYSALAKGNLRRVWYALTSSASGCAKVTQEK